MSNKIDPKEIKDFFPVEIQDIIFNYYYIRMYKSVIKELKKERKSAFDTFSKRLTDFIKQDKGAFQEEDKFLSDGYFDFTGNYYLKTLYYGNSTFRYIINKKDKTYHMIEYYDNEWEGW